MHASSSPSMASHTSIPIYLSSTNSNTVSSTKPPRFPHSAGTDCFLCACPQICLPPFYSAFSARGSPCVIFVSLLSWSLQRRECLINRLCPAPHSFLNRTWASVAWFNDWQTANWGSQLSLLFTFPWLLAMRYRRTCSWGCAKVNFQDRLDCGLLMLLIQTRDQTFRKLMWFMGLCCSIGDQVPNGKY